MLLWQPIVNLVSCLGFELEITTERPSFVDRVARMLERVEYRRADTSDDKAAIYRMRHEAYTRDGTVERRPSGLFHDEFDESPNVWLVGVFVDGELAGSLRLHLSASLRASLPCLVVFPDVVNPRLQEGRLVIDVSRFVSKLEFSRQYAEMPYVILRPVFMAEMLFDADYITAACRVEHQAFYKRMFSCVPWCAPREYPNFNRLMALVARDCPATRTAVYSRYPFYHSSSEERRNIFWRSSNVIGNVLETIGKTLTLAEAVR